MREGNFEKVDSLDNIEVHADTTDDDPSDKLWLPLMVAFREHDVAKQQSLLAQMKKHDKRPPDQRAVPLEYSFSWALLSSGNIDEAERMLAVPLGVKATRDDQIGYLWAQMRTSMMRGRMRQARLYSDSLEKLGRSGWGPFTFPFVQFTAKEVLATRKRLAARDSVNPPGDTTGQMRTQFWLYDLAMCDIQLGRTKDALAAAQRIETLPVPHHHRAAMRALATDVRALADVRNGNPQRALSRLDSVAIDVPFDLLGTTGMRWEQLMWRGEMLYRAGRYEEALRWFENVPDVFGGFPELDAFFMFRRAQIHDRQGNTQQAAKLYAKFLSYWKDPDPELRAFTLNARDRLTEIQKKIN